MKGFNKKSSKINEGDDLIVGPKFSHLKFNFKNGKGLNNDSFISLMPGKIIFYSSSNLDVCYKALKVDPSEQICLIPKFESNPRQSNM